MRLLETKQRLEEVQVCEEKRKKYVEAKIVESEENSDYEEDSDSVDLLDSSIRSHWETADKRTETWVDKMPNLNPVVIVTEPNVYTSGLDTVPYTGDVIPVCNAQLGGLSSTMHGAEVSPMIRKYLTQIAAGTILTKYRRIWVELKSRYYTTTWVFSCQSVGVILSLPRLLILKLFHQLRI